MASRQKTGPLADRESLFGAIVVLFAAGSAAYMVLPKLQIRPQTIREEATVYAVFAIE